MIAPTGDYKCEVVDVAEYQGALLEGNNNQLLYQQVENELVNDAALRRPVLEVAEPGLVALELDSGAAVLEVVAEPGEQSSLNPLSRECGEDGMGACKLKYLLQIEEDCDFGALVDLRQEGDDPVLYT